MIIKIIFMLSKKNTNITFKPDNFHGVLSGNGHSDKRYIIAINIWENYILMQKENKNNLLCDKIKVMN